MSRALAGYSVRSGLTVTQRAAGANMSVDVAAGTYLLNNVPGTYAVTTNVAVDAADSINPRLDILYINSSGVLTIAKGTAAAISPAGETNYKKFEVPYPADLSGTAGIPLAIIHVGAGVSSITNADIWMMGSISELGYLEKLITDTIAKGAPRAQDTPDMTIYVAGFQAYINGALVSFAGGNSPAMSAPSANPRIDRVYLTDAGALAISTGAEDASPTAPALVDNTVPICLVYHRVGATVIKDADDSTNSYIYRDDRPIFQDVSASDVVGPASSVDKRIARFNGITGKVIEDSGKLITDFADATHATRHKSGGADAIKLDELAAPTDVTTLNASTSAHGLLRKLSNVSTEFLNGQGSWANPVDLPSLSELTALDDDDLLLVYDSSAEANKKFKVTPVVYARAVSSGQYIPHNTATIINYANVVQDSHSAITTGASWKFTAPKSGYYTISATVAFESEHHTGITPDDEGLVILCIYVDGAAVIEFPWAPVDSAMSPYLRPGVNGTITLYLAADSYVQVKTTQNFVYNSGNGTYLVESHITILGR